MGPSSTDRDAHFPAIEKKHGQPMTYWLNKMNEISDLKYAEHITYLRENHGFSQVHANALVLYSRGSKSPKRVTSIGEFLEPFDETKRATVRKIFKVVTDKYSDMKLVIAWNQPMLKQNGQYILGVSVHKNHILIAPFSTKLLEQFLPRLSQYQVNKKTFKVPVDWNVDTKLLQDLAAARLAEFQ